MKFLNNGKIKLQGIEGLLRKDIESVLKFLEGKQTFYFPRLNNGLFPAVHYICEDQKYINYQFSWVRDNFYIANCHRVIGETDVAVKVVRSLMEFFSNYRHKFMEIISGKVDPSDDMNRPHIRFDSASLQEIAQNWPHAQNDALGYFLWFYCILIKEGKLMADSESIKVLNLFIKYFAKIRYWQDADSGHWEEARGIRASSIGVVVAALKLFLELQQKSIFPLLSSEITITTTEIIRLINKGEQALKKILPFECMEDVNGQKRLYDSALLFLIYPLDIISRETADKILENEKTHLLGEYGIRRYIGDSFWCADYKEHITESERTSNFSKDIGKRDALLIQGQEAQWCIFDPIISIIHGQRYLQDHQVNDLNKQLYYLNRSLDQLTGPGSPFGEYKCTEAYYLEKGHWVPNDATPLLWTQANLRLALHQMEISLS